MSFRRKRNGKYYLCWNEKTDGKWHQRSRAISTDLETFQEAKAQFDYQHTRRAHGLGNLKKPWSEFSREFLATKRGQTAVIYEYALKRFQAITKINTISEFTQADAQAYRAAMDRQISAKGKTLSQTTINMELRCIKALFAEAYRQGIVRENVFRGMKQTPIKRLPKYLSIPEIRALKEKAKESRDDLYLLVLFFLHTGARLREVLNLRWDSIDLNKEVLYLRGDRETGYELKTRSENALGLHQTIIDELRKATDREGYVFKGVAGKPRDFHAVIHRLNRLYRRSGIKATGAHILRHSFATYFTGHPRILQKILGHQDLKTTLIYSHVTPEALKAVKDQNY